MEAVAPIKEVSDLIRDAGGDAFRLCFQCGLCTVSCPWNSVRSLSPHQMICQARFGLADIEDEAWWLCTTCNLCVSRCPRGVAVTDIMRSVRSILLEYQYSMAQPSLRSAMGSLGGNGNPWGEERAKRADWARDLPVRTYTPDMDLLYFPCCVPACDPKLKSIARATASILQAAGVSFGILGEKETCCGESVRKAGNNELFENLAKENISAFHDAGVKEIVASSPHCYTTFKEDYPGLGGDVRVVHFTQYAAGLIQEGRLGFTKELNKRVVYHDPCYLGRHNGIYDEPRYVLGSIPGLELMDETDSRENSLCCGGGGGRIWMETKKGERFSDILINQAVARGAEIVATACPYCILNFKDSIVTNELEDVIQVKDISEVVASAL
ncbi:MAG: (Fe-S)-binding protein [Deltaproteobacteria bacterium]|nr:(Fe-S)-binding protein [Deltaproteobacteria bacterium]